MNLLKLFIKSDVLKLDEKIALNTWATIEFLDMAVRYYELPERVIMNRLNELEDTHGVKAIIGLWGWLLEAKHSKLTSFQTWPIISQDLDKRNKPDETLITAEFYSVAENYFYNHFINTISK